jgi:hypothetical protein
MAIIIGDRVVQTGDSGYQPQGIFGVASNQGGGPAGMTFGEAASVKIPTIYEYTGTGDDGRGKLVVKETRPGIMSEQEAQQAQAIIDKNQPATAGGLTAEQLRQPKTGIFGIDTSNLGLPTINPALGAIQGFQNTNQVLEKLSKGSKLNPNDKITLINLRNNLDADTRTNLFLKYSRDNKVKLNDIISNFNEEYEKIEESVEDQKDNLQSYFDRMDKMGLGDTAKTMFGDVTRTRDIEEGITTLEDLTKPADEGGLGTEGLQFLKVTNPQAYYRLRPNDRDLANESFVSTGDPVADRQFNAKIMEARAEAMNRQSRQDANMNQGIAAASPALPGISVPAGGTVSSPAVTPNPVLTPIPVGGVAPTTTSGITPFNINQFYASLPQYVQSGVIAPINLSRFTDALRMFPGATV